VQIQLLLLHILAIVYVRAKTPTVSPVVGFTPSVQTSVISSNQSQIVDVSYPVCTPIYLQDNRSSSNFYALLTVHLSIILSIDQLITQILVFFNKFIIFLFLLLTRESKFSFYEELEQVFDHFPKYMKMLLGDFNAKVGR